MTDLKALFNRCLNAQYKHVENDGDYALEREGDSLYILFECSNGKVDWKNNFDFPAKPYKDMEITWSCHRGFLKVWKSIEPYIANAITDPTVKKITIVGYSHGAAIASLCHEYVWYNRPDVRENGLIGYGFGCPRCYFGIFGVKRQLKERWKNFYPVRDLNDLVTHLPPVIFGFRHVNKVLKLQNKHYSKHVKLKCINAHYPDNYIKACKEYDKLIILFVHTTRTRFVLIFKDSSGVL